LLRQWLARTTNSQTLHYKAADRASYKNTLVGTAGIFCGITVALSALYPTAATPAVTVLAGVGAAIASAMQTVYKWGDKSERHKSGGVIMGQIRMKIEQLLVPSGVISEQAADTIREQVNLVLPHLPRIPFDFFSEDARS
jgi:hypothetical protein